jgi:hypothetical protein
MVFACVPFTCPDDLECFPAVGFDGAWDAAVFAGVAVGVRAAGSAE